MRSRRLGTNYSIALLSNGPHGRQINFFGLDGIMLVCALNPVNHSDDSGVKVVDAALWFEARYSKQGFTRYNRAK